ncbi:MAG TPA: hypothetical protein VG651_05055 [Stellaceae bacterium]|nr:hypothetical protein [Stellaceae bacterium]
MRGTLLAALALTVGLSAGAAAQNVGGRYQVRGTNPNGSTYSGTAEIIPNGNVCRINWHVGSEWRGICMLSGGRFAASYHSGDTVGLLIYRLNGDGSLSGEWTTGAGATGTETLIPMR